MMQNFLGCLCGECKIGVSRDLMVLRLKRGAAAFRKFGQCSGKSEVEKVLR